MIIDDFDISDERAGITDNKKADQTDDRQDDDDDELFFLHRLNYITDMLKSQDAEDDEGGLTDGRQGWQESRAVEKFKQNGSWIPIFSGV